jgi:hypothetical protein
MGSGAPGIGRQVAERLHIDYVDREIIAEVAAQVRWSQQEIAEKETPPGSLLGRIAEALKHVPIGTSYPGVAVYQPTWEIPLEDTSYLAGLESVIKELAKNRSIVIRGRGSQFILRGYPGAFHVLVVAPLELRVKRVMERQKLSEAAARKEIARFDSSHREFIKRYFKADLEDPIHYDLVINSAYFSFEAAADIIVNALPLKNQP